MKNIDYKTLKPGDLVQVPRSQFAPLRQGWNGWLFSDAVVIRKGRGNKSGREGAVVEMCVPGPCDTYKTMERFFRKEYLFETHSVENARRFLTQEQVTDMASFREFLEDPDTTGYDWILFLSDKGFLFPEEKKGE